MTALMTGYGETGIANPKFVRRRKSDGFWWNTSGTPAFQVYNAGQIANYGIAATETGAAGVYTATDPSDTTAGDYLFLSAAGASLVVSDVATGVRWQDGVAIGITSAEVTAAVPTVAQIAAQVTTDHGAGSYIRNTEPDNTSAAAAASSAATAATNTTTLLSRVTGAVCLSGVVPSWYSAPADVSADVTAIKAKTDKLTFTTGNNLDSNVLYVHNVQVVGTGETGDEWGPV